MSKQNVREITIRLVVDNDGPDTDFYLEEIQGVHQDAVVSVGLVSETVREATEDESDSMCWDDDN